MKRKHILEKIQEACEGVENVDEVWNNVEPVLNDVIGDIEIKVKEIRDKLSIESGSYSDLDDALSLADSLADELY
tara:strand:+ start:6344 stop:6568 length:225 start_codon:yes stop_codon:yes gene_type:complete